MENKCKIIADLLPLYLDEVCSDESKMLVEEHLKECEECRLLAEDMKKNIPNEKIPAQNDAQVLKKTAWIINKKSMRFAVGVTLIAIYWIVYIWQESLANVGDYRYFPYELHEIMASAFLYVQAATLIWFIIFIIKTATKKTWKKNAVPSLILTCLLIAQIVFFFNFTGGNTITTFTQITEIPDEYHIVIEIDNNEYRTLETSPLVTSLVKTDGTLYFISYDYKNFTPSKGILSTIEEVEIPE